MASELAYVLINPYTIAKSRTGGIIARYLSRTDLDLVAVRMFGPSRELVQRYAALVRDADAENADLCRLIAGYIERQYMPGADGKPARVMMLLFEGPDAVRRVWNATGSATLRWGSGETVRDTYGDYVLNDDGSVRYFEPAVLVGPTLPRVRATLRLWCRYTEADGGIVESAMDVPHGDDVERTLVLLKPDNFRFHSSRPGSIIDILSRSGLRIVAAKKFSMSVAQAEEFYSPVLNSLSQKLTGVAVARGREVLTREFEVEIPTPVTDAIAEHIGPMLAQRQFERIVHFMTGRGTGPKAESERGETIGEECLALMYEGRDAVRIIRGLLGATDPEKALPGSVRREFGHDIMVNAAHASDSRESAEREIRIVNMHEDTIRSWADRYYPA